MMEENNGQKTIETLFKERREYWTRWVEMLGSTLKGDIRNIPDLQSEVYIRRQEAVENYHALVEAVASKTKDYNIKYNVLYTKVKLLKIPNTPNYMYSSDSAIRQHIEGELASDKYVITIVDNHAKFMESTIKSIDSIIYAISDRIEVEKIKIGK